MGEDRVLYVAVVERIRSRMIATGTNPHALSLAAGLNAGYVRDLIRGLDDPSKAGVPKRQTMTNLARPLGCSIAYLLCQTDDDAVDAADLVPETTDERKLLARFRGLSEIQRHAILGTVGAMTPDVMIEVTDDAGAVLYRGPERRVGDPDALYHGPERRRHARVRQVR